MNKEEKQVAAALLTTIREKVKHIQEERDKFFPNGDLINAYLHNINALTFRLENVCKTVGLYRRAYE